MTPAYLAEVARALILRGEHLSAIMGPPLRLLPAGAHDVSGGYDPETWRYQLTLDGPSGLQTMLLPAAGVVHLRWSTDAARPWRGVSPLERAGVSAGLLGWLETRLGQEARADGVSVAGASGRRGRKRYSAQSRLGHTQGKHGACADDSIRLGRGRATEGAA